MESLPEEIGQDLDELARNNTESERSGLVNPTNSTKANMLNIVNNILCVVFILFMFYLCFLNGVVLFAFHPTLMSIGWLLLMTSAISSLSPGDAATEWIPIQSRTTRHWILQASGLLFITIGFIVILTNKIVNNKPHFATFHSCFGLFSYILVILTSCGGISALYSMKFRKIVAPVNIKIVHAVAGLVTFSMGMITIMLGLYSAWWNAGDTERYFCMLLLITVLLLTAARPSVKTFIRIRERLNLIRSSN